MNGWSCDHACIARSVVRLLWSTWCKSVDIHDQNFVTAAEPRGETPYNSKERDKPQRFPVQMKDLPTLLYNRSNAWVHGSVNRRTDIHRTIICEHKKGTIETKRFCWTDSGLATHYFERSLPQLRIDFTDVSTVSLQSMQSTRRLVMHRTRKEHQEICTARAK